MTVLIGNRAVRLLLILLAALQLGFWPFTALSASETDGQYLPVGEMTAYNFSDWAGPDIPVWTYFPKETDLTQAPILFVMHGNGRNSQSYMSAWMPLADEKGVILIAPNFSRETFPGSRRYNLGYVFETDGQKRDEAEWSFSAIEPIFDQIVEKLSSRQTHYTIYGHSAGSQFVHRFLYFKPDARIKRVLAANAGWYTLPDFQEAFPYGLQDSGLSAAALKHALETPVVILLGDKDIDAQHRSLRRTPEAMQQGVHRFARGQTFYRAGQEAASALNTPFNWRIEIVPDVAHSNAGMARAAIAFVE